MFALDDLELANVARPERVVEAVRTAVREHLAAPRVPDTVRNSLEDGLRSRASFHFAVPMLEAWLFGDPACLSSAPEPAREVRARVLEGSDPEDFTSDDPEYENDDASSCSLPPSWAGLDAGIRRKHPKRYLEWLCMDRSQRGCTSYRETRGGVRSLGALDWTRLLAHPRHSRYVRAFVADLAEGLDASPSALLLGHDEALLTCRKHDRSGPVLRNL